MLPLFDNIPTRRLPFATYAVHDGGFAFGFLALKAFQVRPPPGPRQRR